MSELEKVVIFDQKSLSGENAASKIKEMGFDAVTLAGEENALEHLRDMHPALVLYSVSGFDNGDIFSRLRERTESDEIPMLVFSEDASSDLAERFLGLGADDIISSNLPEPVFRAKVHNCIRRKRSHDHERHRLEDLQKDLRFRTLLMRTASHDLRNPLGIILGYLDMLETSLVEGKPTGERDLDRLHKIRKAAMRMQTLISTFLNHQKVHVDAVELEMAEGSLPELARSLHKEFRDAAAERGVTLSYVEEPGLPQCRMDRECLSECLNVLLDNSLKASSRGQEVALRIKQREGAIRVEVQDWGPPLPPEIRPSLFDAVPLDTTKAPSGERRFQFELFLLNSIVRAHGGRAGAEFPDGDSTLIWFEIPAP